MTDASRSFAEAARVTLGDLPGPPPPAPPQRKKLRRAFAHLTDNPAEVSILDQSSLGQFVRRVNRDGSVDSICLECFATVATADIDVQLVSPEREHVCEPGALYRFTPVLRPKAA